MVPTNVIYVNLKRHKLFNQHWEVSHLWCFLIILFLYYTSIYQLRIYLWSILFVYMFLIMMVSFLIYFVVFVKHESFIFYIKLMIYRYLTTFITVRSICCYVSCICSRLTRWCCWIKHHKTHYTIIVVKRIHNTDIITISIEILEKNKLIVSVKFIFNCVYCAFCLFFGK